PRRGPGRRRPVAAGVQGQSLLRPLRGRPADLPPPGEVDELRRTRDCLDAFAGQVTATGEVTAEDLRRVDDEVVALIDDTVAQAKAAPEPDPADLLTDVYVRYGGGGTARARGMSYQKE